ncbi:MAG: hypothetical protein ABWZ15_16145 [Acidimicrobiia bacterium]
MSERRPPEQLRPTLRWAVTGAATGLSWCTLELAATAAGSLLVASPVLDGASPSVAVGFLLATYALWVAGLRLNLVANWLLLEQTGASTNLPSKVMFELARARSRSRRLPRAASAVGYVATEIAKEAPYYAGAFGTALLSDTVNSTDALVFLAGTNVCAAAYEYCVARLSRTVLDRTSQRVR